MTGTALDAATTELLAGSLRELLASVSAGGELGPALDALGWAEVLADDPATATTLLFTEHGRALVSSRALDDVLLAELDPALPPAAGSRALLYPHPAEGADPAPLDGPLWGVLLGPLHGVDEVVVPATAEGRTVLVTVAATDLAAAGGPATGFDLGSTWHTVAGPRPPGSGPPAPEAWTRAVAAGRRALAAEMIGVCESALTLATAHTTDRVQYGRPIASFQAVRHRLAEAYVAVTAARAVLDAAWTAAGGADGGGWAAAAAKLQAGRAQAQVMRHAVQVCGAMGLSQESELHRHVTRAAALDALLGGHMALAESAGAALLAGADVHPVVEL
ncbi:MAG: putative Acyl-CoA dehydrogenase, short-chain specific [Actinoallomurus sp.]|nr:putative Acyl-CoA dehydrogenase, short-chain specific [Actinoallomurus sp.]